MTGASCVQDKEASGTRSRDDRRVRCHSRRPRHTIHLRDSGLRNCGTHTSREACVVPAILHGSAILAPAATLGGAEAASNVVAGTGTTTTPVVAL
jgi:hypothetical protein